MKYKLILFILIMGILSSSVFIVKADYSCSLDGYIIYIDAGHGGKDNGAYKDDVLEDTINLSISKLLIKELVDKGALVYSTRDGDYDLAGNYDKNRKAKDLKNRVSLINQITPDIFISLHLNTFLDEKVKGGQTFYQNNKDSQRLATYLQDEFNELSNKNKKPKLGDYYLLNRASVTGVIIECGFLTNKEDLSNLIKEEYQKKIAKVITRGIYKYFKE